MLTRVWKYVVGLLLIITITLGFLYSCQRASTIKAKGQAQEAVETSQRLSQELTEASQSHRVDLDAISEASKQKDDIASSSAKVKEKVDAVAAKVQAGQISDSDADAVYLDSMWEAYCKGTNDPTCASRLSGSGHKGKPAPSKSD